MSEVPGNAKDLESRGVPAMRVLPIAKQANSIFFANFASFFLRTAILMLPSLVFRLTFIPAKAPGQGSVPSAGVGLVYVVLELATTWLATAAMLFDVHGILVGRRIEFRESLAHAWPRLGVAAGVSLACGLMTALGFVALIIPGIILSLALSLAVPIAVLEGRGISASVERSRSLTRGYRWRIGAAMFLSVLPLVVVFIGLSILSMVTGQMKLLFGEVFNFIFTALGASLSAVTTGIVYFEVRRLKEGVSAEEIAGSLGILRGGPSPLLPR